ncbi:MAG: endonuclease III [Bradymonadaceae bacterium]|nr:endonuclease III [Lujinxingiaceae bacterium]
MATLPSSSTLAHLLEALYLHHGRPQSDGPDDVLGTLVRTILSQQTTSASASKAFGQLVDCFEGDWQAIADAPLDCVVEAVAIAGLARQKASRIQTLLHAIYSETGEHSLEFLHERSPDEARDYLCAFKGVGPKTAAYTLMAAAEMPLFPMDTHILRIFRRFGWLDDSTSDAAAHTQFEPLIAPAERFAAHVVLVGHGRKVCHARQPDCPNCPVARDCLHGLEHGSKT